MTTRWWIVCDKMCCLLHNGDQTRVDPLFPQVHVPQIALLKGYAGIFVEMSDDALTFQNAL